MIAGILGAVVVMGVVWIRANREPRHNGKAISEWFEAATSGKLQSPGRGGTSAAAQSMEVVDINAAFKGMGSEAVPYLIDRLKPESRGEKLYAKTYKAMPGQVQELLARPRIPEADYLPALRLLREMGPVALPAEAAIVNFLNRSRPPADYLVFEMTGAVPTIRIPGSQVATSSVINVTNARGAVLNLKVSGGGLQLQSVKQGTNTSPVQVLSTSVTGGLTLQAIMPTRASQYYVRSTGVDYDLEILDTLLSIGSGAPDFIGLILAQAPKQPRVYALVRTNPVVAKAAANSLDLLKREAAKTSSASSQVALRLLGRACEITPEAHPILLRAMPYAVDHTQRDIVAGLAHDESAIPILIAGLNMYSYHVLIDPLKQMSTRTPQVMEELRRALKHERATLRCPAALILGLMGTNASAALPDLEPLLSDGDSLVRYYAARAIWRIDRRATPLFEYQLQQVRRKEITEGAGRTCLYYDIEEAALKAVPELIPFLGHGEPLARRLAAMVLGAMGAEAKAAAPVLANLREDPDEATRMAAIEASQLIERAGSPP